MKPIICMVVLMFVLCGCAPKAYETLSDVYPSEAVTQGQQMQIDLPPGAAIQTIANRDGKLIFCDGYEIAMQTMASGDMNATVKYLTGFEASKLTILKTKKGDMDCYSWAWSAAGEAGEQIGRGVILDDGICHYCLCMMAPATDGAVVQDSWQTILDSFSVG